MPFSSHPRNTPQAASPSKRGRSVRPKGVFPRSCRRRRHDAYQGRTRLSAALRLFPSNPLPRRSMSINPSVPLWRSIAILAGRLIFAGVFIMAASFKFLGMDVTASYIASAGFPFPLLLAWVAAIFESPLTICLLTGAFFLGSGAPCCRIRPVSGLCLSRPVTLDGKPS